MAELEGVTDFLPRLWEGCMAAQGRHVDAHMDVEAFAHWMFGMMRSELRNPHQARRVLRHLQNFLDEKYPEIVPETNRAPTRPDLSSGRNQSPA